MNSAQKPNKRTLAEWQLACCVLLSKLQVRMNWNLRFQCDCSIATVSNVGRWMRDGGQQLECIFSREKYSIPHAHECTQIQRVTINLQMQVSFRKKC